MTDPQDGILLNGARTDLPDYVLERWRRKAAYEASVASAERVRETRAKRRKQQLRASSLRPLKRVAPGVYESRDGRWTFAKHWSDPAPQRWFAYLDADPLPSNEGSGITTLKDLVDWAQTQPLPATAAEPPAE